MLKYPRPTTSTGHFLPSRLSLSPETPSLFTQTYHVSPKLPHTPILESPLEESFKTVKRTETFKRKPKALRRLLILASGVSAVLGWVASVLGYVEIRMDEGGNERKIAICLISITQVVLLLIYASTGLRYAEYLRIAVRESPVPTPTLLRSPWLLTGCAIEAAFHMLVIPPYLKLQAKEANLTPQDCLFILLLLRNYHSIRFFYWYSRFSHHRIPILASIACQKPTTWTILRSYIACYSLKLVLFVYCVFTVFSGLVIYVIERNTPETAFSYLEDGLYVVAVSQTTVGYGDVVPSSYLGELSIVVNCFLGSWLVALITSSTTGRLALNRAECALYSELVYMRYRRKNPKQAVILIQRWWRFMVMRLKRQRNGAIIVNFYSHLRTHRRVLAAAHGQKDRSFDLQLSAFSTSTSKQIRSFQEYLQPISLVIPLVPPTQTIELMRNEYQLKCQTRSFSRFANRHKSRRRSSGIFSIASQPSPCPSSTNQTSALIQQQRRQTLAVPKSDAMGFVMAKRRAHKKVIGRLSRQGEEIAKEVPSPISAFK